MSRFDVCCKYLHSRSNLITFKRFPVIREFRETRAIAPARALARLNYFRRAVGRTRKTIASHS